MALTVKWDIRGTVNGRDFAFASPSVAPTLALSQLIAQDALSIANNGTALLYNPTGASNTTPPAPLTFDFLYALATVAMFLELTCNEGDAQERVFAVPLAAGFPFVLFADDAFYNFTAGPSGNAFAGTLDVLDRLIAKNQSGATGLLSYAIGKL